MEVTAGAGHTSNLGTACKPNFLSWWGHVPTNNTLASVCIFASSEGEGDACAMNPEKLAKMAAQVRTGGKGSVRRKKKAIHKTTTTDDKRLQNTLKRLGVNNIPAIEEVNLFKDNGTVIHFNNPKVQASIAANTYVVSGHAETKKLQDLLPGIINQLGPDNLANLKKLAETYQGGAAPPESGAADDEDVPDLVDNFEEAAN